VLSEDGGALAKMKPLFKWGLGAPLGTGKQPFTWVHEDDLVAAILHLVNKHLSGAYNICGETVTNRHFSKVLAKSVNRWMLPIPVPAFIMKFMLGEMSEMLLNGVNADASKLLHTGFEFRFKQIDDALK
jgi:NAD dependent epimerase/dehydratase family enzyme